MKQLRNSRQRQMILQAVRNRGDHPSAAQIYIDTRMMDDKISRGTVYRNLNLLAESGEIRRVEAPDMDRFDRRRERHYHLMCIGCGKMTDLSLPYQEQWDEDVSTDTGYIIDSHRTMFEGLCPECAGQEKG